jgi:hypothetical protein
VNSVKGVLVIAALTIAGSPAAVPAQEFSRWTSFCEGIGRTAGIALGDLDGDGHLDVIL